MKWEEKNTSNTFGYRSNLQHSDYVGDIFSQPPWFGESQPNDLVNLI